MSLSDPEVLELNALCNALVDGVITEAERARLAQMLLVGFQSFRSVSDRRGFFRRGRFMDIAVPTSTAPRFRRDELVAFICAQNVWTRLRNRAST